MILILESLNAMTKADSIFRLPFGLALLPVMLLFTTNPAAAAECASYPQVSWWGDLTHAKTIAYVNKNHGGDWSSYLTKWERQLSRVKAIKGMGKGIKIPSTGMKLEGNLLVDYINKLQQRVNINRCLFMQEASESTVAAYTKSQTDIPDDEEPAKADEAAVPEPAPDIPSDESDLADLPDEPEMMPEPEPEPALQPETFEEAVAAFRAGDYEAALKALRPLAEGGMANAQNALGYFYRSGIGVNKDLLQSMFWYQKSARQGNAVGQYSLGEITRKEGTTNIQQAVAMEWIMRAANQNYADAQYTLGLVFFQGSGIDQDVPQSYFWLALGKQNEHAKSAQLFAYVETLIDEDMRLEQDEKVDDWLSSKPARQ